MAAGDQPERNNEVSVADTEGDVGAPPSGWHPEEREHRRSERRFWNAYIGLTVPIVIGAVLSAFFCFIVPTTPPCRRWSKPNDKHAAEAQIDVARDTEHRQLAYLHINHGPMTVSNNT